MIINNKNIVYLQNYSCYQQICNFSVVMQTEKTRFQKKNHFDLITKIGVNTLNDCIKSSIVKSFFL